VIGSGSHRISLKAIEGEAGELFHYFCLVRDGCSCRQTGGFRSPDGWFLSDGSWEYDDDLLHGDNDVAVTDGQIVTMEADLDRGTLRFWVDGKQFTSYNSGVKGRVRWAVGLGCHTSAVQIVPTPEMDCWLDTGAGNI
jgi:hypothetical protein